MNKYMKIANELAQQNILTNHGGPFGAVIVKDGVIVGKGNNQVVLKNDPTAHAEIVAIRAACKTLNTFNLTGCEIYTNCYPCPMCLSAIMWANIKKVYYGTNLEDAEKIGFKDKKIYDYLKNNDNNILNIEQLNYDECLELFKEYQRNNKEIY